MKRYIIREVMKCDRQTVYGITIPQHLAQKFNGVRFSIIEDKDGKGILLESGCSVEERKKSMPNRLDW